jgi:hypothetical protein
MCSDVITRGQEVLRANSGTNGVSGESDVTYNGVVVVSTATTMVLTGGSEYL